MESLDKMRAQMNFIERAMAWLPGTKGYKEKEMRRAADRQVREGLAKLLEDQRTRLISLQRDLLASGGLEWVDDLERAVGKLQLLIDQIKTATYGYAGFFDANKVREAQIEALVNFDEAMVRRVADLQGKIDAVAQAAGAAGIGPAIRDLVDFLADLNQQWRHREEAMRDASE
jgi:hypothetical protein